MTGSTQMRAALLYGPGDIRVEDRPVPMPGDDEVQIQVTFTGVCGTDIHHFDGWNFGDVISMPVPPAILGHEFSGVISAVGDTVTGFKLGDRVSAQPQVYCGDCDFCQRDSPNMCRNKIRFEHGGSWAEFIVVNKRSVFAIPAPVSMKLAALTEPLGCSLRAVERSGVNPGDNVFIAGGGSIGLMIARLCRQKGAAKIFVSEPRESRRSLAEQLGADRGLDPKTEDIRDIVYAETDGVGPDVCFEAVGIPETARECVDLVRRGGTVALMGVANPKVSVEFSQFDFFAKELTVMGSFLLVNTFPRCLDLMASLGLDPLITHTFPLEEAKKAVETAKSGEGTKVMLETG